MSGCGTVTSTSSPVNTMITVERESRAGILYYQLCGSSLVHSHKIFPLCDRFTYAPPTCSCWIQAKPGLDTQTGRHAAEKAGADEDITVPKALVYFYLVHTCYLSSAHYVP